GGHLLDTRLAFITCHERPPAWVGRGMEVLEQTTLKRIAATCRRHDIESATVWARGFDSIPRTGLREGRQGIIVAARVGDARRSIAWVGRPL
ncbi:MAG: hypothetical protein KDC08_12030, partial [Actinobacteria bacterium]|nr:hypothetical protein [Actinomycetota bacterium]